jgi:2,3-bisphosphoglycerate-dependent phosphoglycerate mutase
VTHLYLIRHGEAVSNVDRTAPTAGMRGDQGLTPLGVQQAERLRDRLAATGEVRADVLIASTLPRARQTAEIIAPALDLPIIWDDDVQELDVGEADGVPWNEVEANLPDFRREPFRPLAPGGESWPRFVLRVASALDRIIREHDGKTIVVVCHGGVVDAAFVAFVGLGFVAVPPVEFHTRNTSITHWKSHPREHERPLWQLISYNDDVHVRDIGAEERIHWPKATPKPGGAEEPAVPLPTEESDEG